jgi:hypothetical protein
MSSFYTDCSLPAWAAALEEKLCKLRLFQNFSFWNSFLEFSGKIGLLPVFPGAWFKTNRVLEQARKSEPC